MSQRDDPTKLSYKRTLEVSELTAYGRTEYRPENDTALFFAELVKQKNLTPKDIEHIKKLGFEVRLKGGTL